MTHPQSPHTPVLVEISRDLEDIVPTFLENRKKDLQTLRVAADTQDFMMLQTRGHRMKGDGGGYGFEAISTIGAGLETAAKEQNLPLCNQHLAELEDFLNRVTVRYR